MAALEISDELSGLFKRLEQGQRLLNPADQSIFATEITRRRLTPLLIEALETFSERKPEDIEWEAFHCREYRQQVLEDLKDSRLGVSDPDTEDLLRGLDCELPVAVHNQLRRAAMTGLLMLLSGWFLTYLARGSQEVPTSLILNGGYWIGFIMMGIGVFNFFLQIMEL